MTYEEFRAARKHLTKSDYYTYAELESAGSNVGFACDGVLTFFAKDTSHAYDEAVLAIVYALRECEEKIDALEAAYRADHPVLWPPREWEDREWAEFAAELRGGNAE